MAPLKQRRGVKSAGLVLALAALTPLVAAAAVDTTRPNSPGFCNDIQELVSDLHSSPTVTPFCSTFLNLATPTSTLTATVTDSTCAETATEAPHEDLRRHGRKRRNIAAQPQVTKRAKLHPRSQAPLHFPDPSSTPAVFKSQPPEYIATACSCLGLVTPTAVRTTTVTTTVHAARCGS